MGGIGRQAGAGDNDNELLVKLDPEASLRASFNAVRCSDSFLKPGADG